MKIRYIGQEILNSSMAEGSTVNVGEIRMSTH